VVGLPEFESGSQAPKARRMDQATPQTHASRLDQESVSEITRRYILPFPRHEAKRFSGGTGSDEAMKRAVPAIAITLSMMTLAFAGCLSFGGGNATGWSESDLVAPGFSLATHARSLPSPLTVHSQPSPLTTVWEMSDTYAVYGGMMWVSVNNTGSRELYVYGLALQWDGTNLTYEREASTHILPGQIMEVGMISYGAPAEEGAHNYSILLDLAVSDLSGTWSDKGRVHVATDTADVLWVSGQTIYDVTRNPTSYYNKVNELVNFTVVEPEVELVQAHYPGTYSMLQVTDAYEWCRRNVEYKEDAGDYWQSANETLTLRTGDCEDFAILLASMVDALGGNARLNVIDGHAFATVFIGTNDSAVESARASIASYYWINESALHMTFLEDDTGIWLVIDPVGIAYAGGLPALSRPVAASDFSDDWTFEDTSFLYTIDATGRPASSGGLFGL